MIFQFVEFEHGPLQVWEEPAEYSVYVIGADVAEGLEFGDFSSAHVLNIKTGQLAATWHGKASADDFGHALNLLGRWFNVALIGVEANNHGLTTITTLRQVDRYPNLYRRHSVDKATNKRMNQIGWYTTKTSKPLMIDELGIALKAGELSIPCEATIAELRTYVLDVANMKMHGSPHDDRVISLAIANQMRKVAFQPEFTPQVNDEFTLDWWARQLPSTDQNPNWQIGQNLARR